jgi:hypothetical protein
MILELERPVENVPDCLRRFTRHDFASSLDYARADEEFSTGQKHRIAHAFPIVRSSWIVALVFFPAVVNVSWR